MGPSRLVACSQKRAPGLLLDVDALPQRAYAFIITDNGHNTHQVSGGRETSGAHWKANWERMMLKNLSKQIRDCYQHAEDCARKAAAQTDPRLRQDYLDLEQGWRLLAHSCDLTQRLTDFSNEVKRRKTDESKSGPIPYSCPGCGAEYYVVTVDARSDTQACRWCSFPFPACEGATFLRYIPRPPYLRHKRGPRN
jgi:hypothetical protein